MNTTKLLKSFLPEDTLRYLKRINLTIIKLNNKVNNYILSVSSLSPFLSSLYYTFCSSQFRREHHAVIKGKLAYNKTLNSSQNNFYQLRRNTHRLEKGLIMKPRRDIFALDYIQETVDNYINLVKTCSEPSKNDDLIWSHDVLQEYFNVVSAHQTIDKAKEKFLMVKALNEKPHKIPYLRNLEDSGNIKYDQFLALCYRRRSVRWYLQQPVPRELIDQAIFAAGLSPSACNRQPFEFRVFDDAEMVKKVSSIPGGTRGFADNFPIIIVVVGQLRAYFSERDRHVIYIDSSLASMSLMYSLETLGLSSCPINWPDVDEFEEKMKLVLNLDDDERPIMLISVGFPDPNSPVPYSQKKALDQLRRYN